jgi:hypothetical protein
MRSAVGADRIAFRVPYEITVRDKSGKEVTEQHEQQLTARLNVDVLEFIVQDEHGFPPEEFGASGCPRIFDRAGLRHCRPPGEHQQPVRQASALRLH